MKMNTSSLHDKLPILEEGWRCEKGKNVSILERVEKSSSFSRFVEIAKLIFYLELIFFIGWMGCLFLSQHIGNTNYNDSKTETSHACGPSTIDCTPPDIHNEIDHERSMRGFRAKRDVSENELKFQTCINNMNATSEKISQLEKQFVPGEDSDSTIIMLRQKCQSEFVSLTLRVMMEKLVSREFSSDLTDEQWHDYAVDMGEKIINKTGEEHRQKVETPTPEIVTDLRTTVESMISNYRNCEKIVPVGGTAASPSIADLLNEREKCVRITASIKDDVRPIITQIIPGESSDPTTVELRKRVENMTMNVVAGLTFDPRPAWKVDEIPEQVANMTDEKWRKFIGSVRDDALRVDDSGSPQRALIETNAPITQEMINDFRTAVNNLLNKVRNCDEITTVVNKIREDVKETVTRNKRDTQLAKVDTWLFNLFGARNFNQIDHERSMRGFRAKRDVGEDELKRQTCISNMNATSEKISQLEKQLIPGEDSDSTIITLRQKCLSEFVDLTLRVIKEKLVSREFSSDPTDEQWHDYAADMREKLINRTGEEHRQKVKALTPEIVTDLRTTIESMIRNYRDCDKMVPVGGPPASPVTAGILKKREKCERITASIIEDVRPVITQIIPGESSDPTTVELRKRVENMTMNVIAGLTFDPRPAWKVDEIPEQVANMTDEKWRTFIGQIRDDIVHSFGSAQRELIETNAPITQEMINDFRTAVNNLLNKVRNCDEITTVINMLREYVKEVGTRNKRDAQVVKIDPWLRNLFGLGNSDTPKTNGTFSPIFPIL